MKRFLVLAGLLLASPAFAQAPPTPEQMIQKQAEIIADLQKQLAAKAFPRGAKPSPRYKLQSTPSHQVVRAAPTQFTAVPPKLSYWLNNQYGICVTAQEAFSKAAWSVQCGLPELFVPDAEVLRWANKYGFRDGANLSEVMDVMQKDGFTVNGQNYKDGPYSGVDYSNESVLQNAIFTGPVNIAIDADALPSGAGNNMGWTATGGRVGQFPNTDHCVALCGYGPATYLFHQLNLPPPSGVGNSNGYLLFTWNTIGFVDHAWLMSTCVEAWVRNPTTPGQVPAPPPPPDGQWKTFFTATLTPNSSHVWISEGWGRGDAEFQTVTVTGTAPSLAKVVKSDGSGGWNYQYTLTNSTAAYVDFTVQYLPRPGVTYILPPDDEKKPAKKMPAVGR